MLQVFVTFPLTQIIILSKEACSGVNFTEPILLLSLFFFSMNMYYVELVFTCIPVINKTFQT